MKLNYSLALLIGVFSLVSCSNTEQDSLSDEIEVKILKLDAESNEWQETSNPVQLNYEGSWHNLKVELESIIDTTVYISFQSSTADTFLVYSDKSKPPIYVFGDRIPNSINTASDPYPSFTVDLRKNEVRSLFIDLVDKTIVNMPVEVYSSKDYTRYFTIRNLFYGIFIGSLIALMFYNVFIYFASNRLTSYFYYSIFLIFLLTTQLSLLGFTNFILDDVPFWNNAMMFIGAGLLGVFGSRFVYEFVSIGTHFPKLKWVFYYIYVSYSAVVLFALLNMDKLCFNILNFNGLAVSLFIIVTLFIAMKRSIRNARITLIAWSTFFVGVMLFVVKDFGVFSYNPLIPFIMPVGATIAAILLSFALADHINVLQRETEVAQARVIEEMTRNEDLIKNQNVVLEEKVAQRTVELEQTLENLKSAQSKLVESEKMASLGVLTAGIAHEINNPINYVTANVIPLRENIEAISKLLDMYKDVSQKGVNEDDLVDIKNFEDRIELGYTLQETNELVDGIEEGAKRTYTIVEGLRTFSRGDAQTTQLADINKGVESTLAVLKNNLHNIEVDLSLEENLPRTICQLGKLNQVFLNLMNNAIHAVEERHSSDMTQALIKISTKVENDVIVVTVKDNGVGIPEDKRNKVFEPFYTSKPIGKGTGLGLSISYSIMEDHGGSLSFESIEGEGSTFIAKIPIVAENK